MTSRTESRDLPSSCEGGSSKLNPCSRNLTFCTDQALRDGGGIAEKCAGNFLDGKTADRFQAEGDARIARESRIAGKEDHAEFVVAQGFGQFQTRRDLRLREFSNNFRGFLQHHAAVANQVQSTVARHVEQPARRVIGNAGEGPDLQCFGESILHGFFSQVQMRGAEDTREVGDHLSRGTAKQMVHDRSDVSVGLRHCGRLATGPAISRTSRVPPYSSCG